MSKFNAYCLVSIAPVRAAAADESEIVSQLLFGEIIEVYNIDVPWAQIKILSDGYEGYIDHKHLRKLSDNEVKRWSDGNSYLSHREVLLSTPWGNQRISRGSFIPEEMDSFTIGQDRFEILEKSQENCTTLYEYAENYINTPYLWGGKSVYGIDCSGITQVIYRLFGWNLPRDASKQVDHGQLVSFEDIQSGDLAYFNNSKGISTHVGILDGIGNIIHASGHIRKDRLTAEGIIHAESGILTHKLHVVKRM